MKQQRFNCSGLTYYLPHDNIHGFTCWSTLWLNCCCIMPCVWVCKNPKVHTRLSEIYNSLWYSQIFNNTKQLGESKQRVPLHPINRANKFTFRNPHWILQKASVFEKCLEKCSDERMCAKVSRICLAHICIAYDIITVFGNQPPVPRWLNDINILLTVVGNCADSIYNCTSFPRHFIVHKNANNYKNYHTERELSYNSL